MVEASAATFADADLPEVAAHAAAEIYHGDRSSPGCS